MRVGERERRGRRQDSKEYFVGEGGKAGGTPGLRLGTEYGVDTKRHGAQQGCQMSKA